MERFKGLHAALGKPEKHEIPSESFFAARPKNTDEELLNLWREDGWARYKKGLFWTMNPDDFADLHTDWNTVERGAIVFARNAFGDLFLCRKDEVFRLTIQDNYIGKIGSSLYIFLNSTLKEPSLQESFLQKKLFTKVHKRLGVLEADECYGLFPAVPIGGDEEDPAAYQRAKLREYLASVAQMHD